MASSQQISQLRLMVSEADSTTYGDGDLGTLIDNEGSVEAAAYIVWRDKAAAAAGLVDVTEGSSSRRLSQIQSSYASMAALYLPYNTRLNPAGDDQGRTVLVGKIVRS